MQHPNRAIGPKEATMNPDNDLPPDWDLDMQYEDRFSCLGDAETTEYDPYGAYPDDDDCAI